MDGNGVVAKGIVEYNAKVEEYCATNVASTLVTYNNMFEQLYKYNATLSVRTVSCFQHNYHDHTHHHHDHTHHLCRYYSFFI